MKTFIKYFLILGLFSSSCVAMMPEAQHDEQQASEHETLVKIIKDQHALMNKKSKTQYVIEGMKVLVPLAISLYALQLARSTRASLAQTTAMLSKESYLFGANRCYYPSLFSSSPTCIPGLYSRIHAAL